jgi:hypothetical protein
MSKFAPSDDASMAEIERRAAIEAGELYRCTVCEAEQIGDPPVCPTDAVHCNVVTVKPKMGADPS